MNAIATPTQYRVTLLQRYRLSAALRRLETDMLAAALLGDRDPADTARASLLGLIGDLDRQLHDYERGNR